MMMSNAKPLSRRTLIADAAFVVGLAGDLSAARGHERSMAPSRAPAAARPNLIVMVTDDLGYSDIGAYEREIDTSDLDCPSRRDISGRGPPRLSMRQRLKMSKGAS